MKVFLEIEGNDLVNILRISRISLSPTKRVAVLYDGPSILAESKIAYEYFVDPENRKSLYAPSIMLEPVAAA